jgi:oxalate decarboxylase/phosphoglucose isomerase-like protein (cupin superfamily)
MTTRRVRFTAVTAGVLLALSLLIAGPAAARQHESGGDDPPEVTREVLVDAAPAEAPGFEMYLVRVVIPSGGSIATHYHPGTQIAQVQQGTLTYRILEGTATVLVRSDDGGEPVAEEVSAPTTVKLGPGEGVIETPDLVHEAENKGKKRITILLSALLPAGEPLSIPVES